MRHLLLTFALACSVGFIHCECRADDRSVVQAKTLDHIVTATKALYSETNAADRMDDVAIARITKSLHDHLVGLASNQEVEQSRVGAFSSERVLRRERLKATAWVHGWAVMCRLAIEVSDRSKMPHEVRDQVLDLKPGSDSCLANLLLVYETMARDGEKLPNELADLETRAVALQAELESVLVDAELTGLSTEKLGQVEAIQVDAAKRREQITAWNAYYLKHRDPLRLRLRLLADTGFAEGWPTLPKLGQTFGIEHEFFVPSRSDLCGHYGVTPVLERGMLSLWGLVNLQLDTFRSERTESDPLGLSGVTEWFRSLESLPAGTLQAFDEPLCPGNRSYGTDFGNRVRKIRQFLEVRSECANDRTLADAVRILADRRLTKGDVLSTPIGKSSIKELCAAATHIDGESLPQAECWLRYLIALSYQELGTAAAISDSTGMEQFLGTLLPQETPARFTLDAAGRESSSAFLRWNKWPSEGHFVRRAGDGALALHEFAKWERQSAELAKKHFRVVGETRQMRVAYGQCLRQHSLELDFQVASLIHPHLAPTSGRNDVLLAMRSPEDSRERYLEKLLVLTSSSKPKQVFIAGTDAENLRIDQDLANIGRIMESAGSLRSYTADAYLAGNAGSALTAFQGQAGSIGLTQWSADCLPRRSFDSYRTDVDEAVRLLKATQDNFSYDEEIRSRFQSKVMELEAIRIRRDATLLAETIAQRAKEISRLYEAIAQRRQQIAQLDQDVARLIADAQMDQVKRSTLRLSLRTRAYDLAVAQLASLEEALTQAQQLAKDAEKQLSELQPKLLETAKQIRDEERRAGFIKIVKAAVTVVGAVLAPFTGGVSALVATGVNTAIGIYEKLDKLDFSNLSQAVAQIADVEKDVQSIGDLAFDKLGVAGDEGQVAWRDFTKFVQDNESQVRKIGTAIKGLEKETKVLLDGLRRDWEQSKIGSMTSLVGAQLPVENVDGKLRLNLKDLPAIVVNDHQLTGALKEILDSGGVFVSGVRDRALAAELPFLKPADDEYKKKLEIAVDQLVHALPDEMLKDVEGTAQRLKGAKDRLLTVVANLDDKQRECVSRLLMDWTVIKAEDGRIIAIERPLKNEIALLRGRVKALAEGLKFAKLDEFEKRINQKKESLEQKIASVARNADGIEMIAQTEIPAIISSLSLDLRGLQTAIEEARERADQEREELAISELDAVAQAKLFKAAEIEVSKVALEKEVSGLLVTAAGLEAKNAADRVAESRLLVSAMDRDVLRTENELKAVYSLAIRHGVNVDVEHPVERKTLSLLHVLNGTENDVSGGDRNRQALLTQMAAEGLLGMASWLRLMSITTKENNLIGFQATQPYFDRCLTLAFKPTGDDAQIKEAKDLLESLNDAAQKIPFSEDLILLGRGSTRVATDSAEISWMDKEQAPEVERAVRFVAPNSRDQVVAVIEYTYGGNGEVPKNSEWCQFVMASEALLLLKNDDLPIGDLSWALVSPKGCRPNSNVDLFTEQFVMPELSNGMVPEKSVLKSVDESSWKGQKSQLVPLVRTIRLSGAHGTWRCVIVDKKINQENRTERIASWKKAEFEVLFPIINSPGKQTGASN